MKEHHSDLKLVQEGNENQSQIYIQNEEGENPHLIFLLNICSALYVVMSGVFTHVSDKRFLFPTEYRISG